MAQDCAAPQALTVDAFAPYGRVLERNPSGEAFQALFADSSATCGWRVAILEVPPGEIKRVHRHPDSEECFSPLKGKPCIAVARPEAPENIQYFFLDQPVCIHREVWHEVFSQNSEPAQVFIAENAEISGEEHFLNQQ
jgi:ureidoglycolate hydrolase